MTSEGQNNTANGIQALLEKIGKNYKRFSLRRVTGSETQQKFEKLLQEILSDKYFTGPNANSEQLAPNVLFSKTLVPPKTQWATPENFYRKEFLVNELFYADFLLQKSLIIEINGSHHYTHTANRDFNLNFVKYNTDQSTAAEKFSNGESKFNTNYIETFDIERSGHLNMKSVVKNQYLTANGYTVLMIRSDIIE